MSDIEYVNGEFYLSQRIAAGLCGVTTTTMSSYNSTKNPPPYDRKLRKYPVKELGLWIKSEQIFKKGQGKSFPWLPSLERVKAAYGISENLLPGLGEVAELNERDQKLRKLKLEADRIEMELLEKSGTLVNYSDVVTAWSSILVRVKTSLLSVASMVSPKLVGLELTEIEKQVTEAINESLLELSADWQSELVEEDEESEDE